MVAGAAPLTKVTGLTGHWALTALTWSPGGVSVSEVLPGPGSDHY